MIKQKTNLIAIEGIDGSGKTCQADKLKEKLIENGFKAKIISFPNYENGFFGKEIGLMLKGSHEADPSSIDAKSMCLWYALDRLFTLNEEDFDEYDFIIFNRYSMSNIAHQSMRTKFYNFEEITSWIYELEHKVFALPEPDVYIILDIDINNSKANIQNKDVRSYMEQKTHDIYEGDEGYLIKSRIGYQFASRKYLNTYVINCLDDKNKMKSIEEISDKIYSLVAKNFLLQQWS